MTTHHTSNVRRHPPRKFVDHKIASKEPQDVTAVLYEFLLAGNGIFVRAARNEFTVSLPLCPGPIRGLPEVEAEIKWKKPPLSELLWQGILRYARLNTRRSEFKEDVYIIYWHKTEHEWRWKPVGRARSWGSTVADDSVPEYAQACIELHTHPPGAIHFSRADDLDETGKLRIFGIIVDIHGSPQIRFRCGIYDHFFPIPAAWVGDVPSWLLDLNEIDAAVEKLFA